MTSASTPVPLLDNAAPSKQEVFDVVVAHAKAMTKPARSAERAGCLYRVPEDGNRCFIGVLLTDEEAQAADTVLGKQDGYGTSVKGLAHRGQLPARLTQLPINFLEDLQSVHDNTDIDEWPAGLRRVAMIYDLDAGVVSAPAA